jgi:hypothetical protein
VKKSLILLFALTTTAFFLSCKKSSSPVPKPPAPPQTGPFLYIGGTDGSQGVYYKISLTDSAPLIVPDTIPGATNIKSIITQDSDLYIAGGAAGYWKNGSFVSIANAYTIDFLDLSGSNVYAVGFDDGSNLAYWEGNQETNIADSLPNVTYYINIEGIAVADSNAGTNVYVAATADFRVDPAGIDPSGLYGIFCENGHCKLFGGKMGSQITSGILLSGGDVYVAGPGSGDSANSDGGGYWKNGMWNIINTPFYPECIAGSGNNIYIGGEVLTPPASPAAYWENGNLTDLPDGIDAIAIAFNGSDMYVLGANRQGVNVVWKNGVLFTTPNPNGAFSASCLAVGK